MRSFLFVLALLALSVPALASSTYTIGYGDTLWDLSIRFYGTPEFWDDILAANPQIAGVEYLLPGMEIVLPGSPTGFAGTSVYTSLPSYVQAPTLTATVPMLSRIRLENAGFVATGPLASPGSVLAVNVEDQEIESNDDAYTGDIVEIDMGSGDGVSVNSVFRVLEPGETAFEPETGEEIGFIVRVAGLVRVTSVTETTSIALVEHSFLPINAGDLIEWYVPARDVAVNTTPAAEDQTAWVIGLQDPDFSRTYAYDVVYLDRGTESGLEPGDVFVVYNYGDIAEDVAGNRVITADIPISELVVLTADPTTCSALVSSNITGDLVDVGDRIHLARRQTAQTGSR